jgi:L-threonylcarbamoyladenylate synthase
MTLGADDEGACRAAADALLAGDVVLVPTDTVYGLAAMPDHPEAVQRIYDAKRRPGGLHLPVLAASLTQISALGVDFPDAARILAERWWPGPLTMAFGFSATGSRPRWLAGREEVAVRIPDCDFLLTLMEMTGVLVVTSANPHGQPTPTSAQQAGEEMAPYVKLIIDGGALDAAPSTLVNMHAHPVVVEREGSISAADVTTELGLPA